ncbi:MAG: hypothetical protein CMO01_30570 [Thalassobius sp.]|nr:hypothetical protein [Thalassovita sp.]
MKLRFLFLLLTIIVVQAQAQNKYKHLYPGYYGNGSSPDPIGFRIGVNAGISRTDISRDLLVNPDVEDGYYDVYQPVVGLLAQYAFTSKFMVSSGLNFKPMAVDYKTNSDIESTVTNYKKNYIEVPILFNLTFRKGSYKPYPALYAGGSVSYLVNASMDYESITPDTNAEPYNENNQDITDSYNSIDFGPVIGISYYIPIQTSVQLMMDLKGYMGVPNINNLPEGYERPYTINTGATLSIALIWGR